MKYNRGKFPISTEIYLENSSRRSRNKYSPGDTISVTYPLAPSASSFFPKKENKLN